MIKPAKQPRDLNELAFRTVRLSTGQESLPADARDPAAVSLGARGASKGGKARAAKLTSKQRKAISKKGAKARWKSSGSN